MKQNQCTWSEWAAIFVRWLLGALFICLGLSKALHPVEFLKLARQYELVQTPWILNSIAAALPWLEVFCGLLLLAGIAVREAALVALVTLIPFTYIVFKRALVLQAMLGIPFCEVKFDCGCGSGEDFIVRKLLENAVLMGLSAWVLSVRKQKLCTRPHLISLAFRALIVHSGTNLLITYLIV